MMQSKFSGTEFVGTKDEPQDHDWSLYLKSVTRVCIGWLNSVEFIHVF